MYEKFYGLKEAPFRLTPDPEFLYLNKRCKEALDHILYGIERREGFALILGDVGTGKTTLCWAILDRLENKKVRTALVQNPMLSETDILRSILQDLGVRPESIPGESRTEEKTARDLFDAGWMREMSKKELIDRLNRFLADRPQEDSFTVLIIDEAQNLSRSMLEQLRLLSNLETPKRKLLQIIFAGQLELGQKLSLPALRQLDQRISIRFETKTLSRKDLEAYVHHRLKVAGAAPTLRFSRGAFRAIYHYSMGYPRLINLICDRALLAGYCEGSQVITRRMVRKASHNLIGKEYPSLSWRSALIRRPLPILLPLLLVVLLVSVFAWKAVIPRSTASLPASFVNVASRADSPTWQPAAAGKNTEVATEAVARASSGQEPRPANSVPVTHLDNGKKVGFVVQVHSLTREQEAQRTSDALAKAGYPSFTRFEKNESGSEWFVVYVGPFSSPDAASQAAATLTSATVSPIVRRSSGQ